MPLTRIQNTAIGNDGITTAKLDDTTGGFTMPGQQFIKVPVGTTAQRPSSPAAGHLRFNTTLGTLEQYNTNSNSWAAIDSPPVITTLAYSGSKTATDPAGSETITLTGTNFKTGLVVKIGGTTASSVSVASTTSLTFTTPAKTAGDYDVTVTNPNGLTATLTNGISYNGTPAFSTAAGNLGSLASAEAMSTITIVAAEPDGGTLAYSVTSGALPSGVSLGSANGQLTGTPASVASTTTYNFDITATDDENQTNARSFNLIVVRPIYATTIAKSLRFESAQTSVLTRTPSSASNRRTFTLSMWVKPTNIDTQTFLYSTGANSNNRVQIAMEASGTLNVECKTGGSTQVHKTTTRLFRDPAAWIHFTFAFDTTNGTAGDRVKIYVNGVQETSFSNNTNPSQNADLQVNAAQAHYIGKRSYTSNYFDGYMADIHFIDGQQLAPTSFAEEYYGVWVPKAFSGTYGTNGFQLKFNTNSAAGDDTSGNTNDWTASGFSAIDFMIDTPTSNFAIMSDIAQETASHRSSAGGLAVPGPNNEAMGSTIGVNSGKWYWEIRTAAANGGDICPYMGVTDNPFIRDPDAAGGLNVNGTSYANFGSSSTFSNFTAAGGHISGSTNSSAAESGIFGFALDLTAGTLKYFYNGSLKHTDSTIPTDGRHIHPYHATTNSGGAGWNTTIFNFGQNGTFNGTETAGGNADANSIGDFKYAPPSGHLALTTKNFPNGAINVSSDDRPNEYFNTAIWTGNASNGRNFDVGHRSDLVWIKSRSHATNHYLFDSIRGVNKQLLSNANSTESVNSSDRMTAFNANGFQVGAFDETNGSGKTFVGWSWAAGGQPTATNSAGAGNAPTSGSVMVDGVASTAALAGSIPARHMSVNTKAKFSIVDYVGNGSNGATVAHGLGVAPDAIIQKRREGGIGNWRVYHSAIHGSSGETTTLFLNLGGGNVSDGDNISGANSTTFTTRGTGATNPSGSACIAYCFANVEGYSKFGKYTGTGDANGPYVYLGFKPAFVMYKRTDGSADWHMYDNKRDPINVVDETIFTNGSNAAASGDAMDFLSNGFKMRNTGGEANGSGRTYVYFAFAEDPFKYSEGR